MRKRMSNLTNIDIMPYLKRLSLVQLARFLNQDHMRFYNTKAARIV